MPTSIDVPLALCVPPRKGGDATLFEMRADAVSLGIATERVGAFQRYSGITDYSFFPVADMLSLHAIGCVIADYPLTLQLTDAALLLEIPEGLPTRDSVDENGDPIAQTWGDLAYITRQLDADGNPLVRHYLDNSVVCPGRHYTNDEIGVISVWVTANAANAALLSDVEWDAINDANSTGP